jgi:hypothetical protein
MFTSIKNNLACAAALVTFVAVSSPRAARADNLDLSIGSAVRWSHTHSVDALSADDTFGFFSLNAGWRLTRSPIPGFGLALDGTLERGMMDGVTFSRLRSEVSLWSFQVGARAYRDVRSWLVGYGRVALGLQRAALTFTDDFDAGRAMKDKGWAGTAYVGAGFDLKLIRAPRGSTGKLSNFSLGLRYELGYLATSSIEMEARPEDSGGDTIRIPTIVSSLGELNLSSISLRLALVGRF